MRPTGCSRILAGLALFAVVLGAASCDHKRPITAPPPPPPVDSDGDGVPDPSDNCPAVPGEPDFNGCPWYKVDYCSATSPYTLTVRWATPTPAYYYATSLPTGWRSVVDYAASTWSGVARIEIRKFTTAVNAGAAKDLKSVVSYGPLPANVLGVTSIWYQPSTGLITEADIVLNSNESLGIGGGPSSYDVVSVLTHEFGHFCGLDHVTDRSQTMYPSMPPDCTIYRTLCSGDIAGLRRLYP